MQTPSRIADPTVPRFLGESEKLVRTLRRYSPRKLSELMSISDALAELNAERFARWTPEADEDAARPAIQAFRGDVYVGLDADSLGKRDLKFAQKHVRILSGLYGILQPLDLMQAHRLEMGTRLKTRRGQSLYEFWGGTITDALNRELAEQKQPLLVNLASNEYFKSVRKGNLAGSLISPVFKDEKAGNYKVISFFAKKARGAMARHLILERASTVDDVLGFDALGYRFSPSESTEGVPVFLRSEKAAQPYLA